MTRLLNEQEVLHDLRTVGFFIDSGTATTLSANEAAGQTVLSVTSETGFAQGDYFRVGAQGGTCDIAVVESVAAGTITAKLPTAFAHLSTAPVTKLTFVDMGHTSEDGVQQEITQDETRLRAGTQRPTLLTIPGEIDQGFTFSLLGFNPENLAQVLGLDETDATVVVPGKGITMNPNLFGLLGTKSWKFEGIREDLTPVIWLVANAKVSTVNVSASFRTGEATALPMQIKSFGTSQLVIEP